MTTTLQETAPPPSVEAVLDVITQFQRRIIQDALTEASADYWLGRAARFDAARPRPGDYTGGATPEQLAEQDRQCGEIAAACRARAQVSDVLWAGERAILDEAGL